MRPKFVDALIKKCRKPRRCHYFLYLFIPIFCEKPKERAIEWTQRPTIDRPTLFVRATDRPNESKKWRKKKYWWRIIVAHHHKYHAGCKRFSFSFRRSFASTSICEARGCSFRCVFIWVSECVRFCYREHYVASTSLLIIISENFNWCDWI